MTPNPCNFSVTKQRDESAARRSSEGVSAAFDRRAGKPSPGCRGVERHLAEQAAERGDGGPQRVPFKNHRKRLTGRRLDAHRRVVDEDARGVDVQRRFPAPDSDAAEARSTALSAA